MAPFLQTQEAIMFFSTDTAYMCQLGRILFPYAWNFSTVGIMVTQAYLLFFLPRTIAGILKAVDDI